MAHKIGGGAETFVTYPDGDVGIGHEYVAHLAREGTYTTIAKVVWDILEKFIEWYGRPYGDKFSGVDWTYSNILTATEVFLTEETIVMPSFSAPTYGTAWAMFKGAVTEGDGFSSRMFLEWAKIEDVLSMQSLAAGAGLPSKVITGARKASDRIAHGYYEMLHIDGHIEDGGESYWLPSNFIREDGTRPKKIKKSEYFIPGDRDAADLIGVMTHDILERLQLILWSAINRDLIKGFILARMRIVDTSQDSPLSGTG